MQCLSDYPVRTNAAVAGTLCTIGDIVAQFTEWKLGIMSPDKSDYNYMRTIRMAFWGSTICGPLLCLWYRGLHAAAEGLQVSYAPIVSGRFASLLERAPALQWITELQKPTAVAQMTSTQVLLGKVAIDTMIFQAPFLNLYFSFMGMLEGLTLQQIYEKTRASFHRAWALSLLVWTPVQLINLHFVPLPLQPCVVATVNVGWQTTLSILNHYHEYGPLTARRPSDGAEGAPQLPPPAQAQWQQPQQPRQQQQQQQQAAMSAAASARGYPPPGWEVERAQLRARIAQLLAENKTLRLQLGQLHAASYASTMAAASPPAHSSAEALAVARPQGLRQ